MIKLHGSVQPPVGPKQMKMAKRKSKQFTNQAQLFESLKTKSHQVYLYTSKVKTLETELDEKDKSITKKEQRIQELNEVLDRVNRRLEKVQAMGKVAVKPSQLAAVERERDELKDSYLRCHEQVVNLQEEIKDLKAQLTKSYTASSTTNYIASMIPPGRATQFGKEDEQQEHIKFLETRIQNLTEDNDDLRRDNDLLKRHNEANDHQQDAQEQLH